MGDLRTFPLKQGDLDWLCSIYAAINLRHLRGTLSSLGDADKLFKSLITERLSKRKWNIGRYVAEGVDPNADIIELFEAAGFVDIKYFNPHFDIISCECGKQSGLLIYFEETSGERNCFSHYTIATGVTQGGDIELYDSWKFERLVRVGDRFRAAGLDVTVTSAWRIGSPA